MSTCMCGYPTHRSSSALAHAASRPLTSPIRVSSGPCVSRSRRWSDSGNAKTAPERTSSCVVHACFQIVARMVDGCSIVSRVLRRANSGWLRHPAVHKMLHSTSPPPPPPPLPPSTTTTHYPPLAHPPWSRPGTHSTAPKTWPWSCPSRTPRSRQPQARRVAESPGRGPSRRRRRGRCR